MQNIDLICVGKLNAKYFAEGVAEYQKRLAAFAAFRIIELPEEKIEEKNASDAVVKKALDKEGKAILSNVRKGAAIVAMCIEGKQISSDELAQFLAQRAGSGAGDVAFVIGSSHGPERSQALREPFLRKSVESAGKVIFFFSFGAVFIILIAWSILLQKAAKNTGWKNHEKTQKRTAAGGLFADAGDVRGAALQLRAYRKNG